MAGKFREQAHSVDFGFLEDPAGLSFYQAVRRVECRVAHQPRIGHATRSADEPIQFCQEPSLGFAPATL